MKKNVLLLLCLLCLLQAYGQQFDYTRDYKAISKEIVKPTSRLFYDSLKSRFTRNSQLSLNEIVALQIGYTQQPQYNPYGDINLDRTFIQAANWSETDTTVMYGTAYLERNPVSLSATYALWKVYQTRHNDVLASKYKVMFEALIKTMLSTGDGSADHPYLAVGPIDGQILIRQYWQADIGMMGSGRDKHKNFLDILNMVGPDGKNETKHFVIQHAAGRF